MAVAMPMKQQQTQAPSGAAAWLPKQQHELRIRQQAACPLLLLQQQLLVVPAVP
jgi:hypothetical protein